MGLFAADSLGVGCVRGVPPSLYREALFRAAVVKDGLPISDVIQVWLDVSSQPARGKEQADQVRRRPLRQLFEQEPS